MDGILLINKPKDYTSRDVVNIISKEFKTKKVGHTGTLDPLATGVLVLCINKATKLVDLITSYDKEYIAEVIFGIKTDTLDITGNVLEETNIIIPKEKIIEVLKNYQKKYMQQVPIYSAVKINGKKLYEYARENIKIDLPSKEVDIKSIELLDYSIIDNKTIIKFKCLVSKGTYIRSLINDIATNLNTIATMTNLERTKQGDYNIEECYKLDDIKNNNYKFITLDQILEKYFTVIVDSGLEKQILNGCRVDNIYNKDFVLFKNKEKILGLYKNDNNILKAFKMFI